MLIAQISDPHIAAPGHSLDRHFSTTANLERAVDCITRLPNQPDAVIITGDCVNDGTAGEYKQFRDLLDPLDTAVYVLPGNHDNRDELRRIFGEQGSHHHDRYIQYVVELGPLRLVALDTLIPGEMQGRLCADRLAWLEQRLAEDSSTPTLIMQHHPPFAIGIPVMDQFPLDGREELARLIGAQRNVERLLAGHVHCHTQRRFHGTIALTCPSTALQAYPDLGESRKLFGVMSTPACLLHYWAEDTGLVTHTYPIGDHGAVHTLFDGENWVELP